MKQLEALAILEIMLVCVRYAHVIRNQDENGSERRKDRTSKSPKSGSLTVGLCCIVKFIYVRI